MKEAETFQSVSQVAINVILFLTHLQTISVTCDSEGDGRNEESIYTDNLKDYKNSLALIQCHVSVFLFSTESEILLLLRQDIL